MRRAILTLGLVALLLAPALLATEALASGSRQQAATMPTGRAQTSAVWTGSESIVFGGGYGARSCNPQCAGNDPKYDDILIYHGPASDSFTVANAKLPTKRYGTSAVWTGQYAYVFGGFDGADLDQIVRYDPATDTVLPMLAKLPGGRLWTSAVWTGQYAYIFGGYGCEVATTNCNRYLNDIVRYDPSTDTTTTLSASLPSARGKTSAVWTGTHAYVFGGETCYGTCWTNQVVRFNPATSQVTVMGGRFPASTGGTSAVWTGDVAYVFGGLPRYNADIRAVHVYNPANDTLWRQDARYDYDATSATWAGDRAYVFGGYGCNETLGMCSTLREYRADLIDGPVMQSVTATGPGELTISWTAEQDGQTGFRVYRSLNFNGPFSLLADVAGTNTSYVDAGLPNGAKRYYYVTLTGASGESDGSWAYSGTTWSAPAPPSLGVTRGPNQGQVTIQWGAPSNGGTPITEYRIYRGIAPGATSYHATVGPGTLAYSESGLADGETLYFRVTAVNSVGESAASNEVAAKAPTVPSSPQNLRTILRIPGGEYLAWNEPLDNGGIAFSYHVYRGTTPGNHTFLAELPSGTREFQDTTCRITTTCYYVVKAVNALGASLPSNEVSRLGTSP